MIKQGNGLCLNGETSENFFHFSVRHSSLQLFQLDSDDLILIDFALPYIIIIECLFRYANVASAYLFEHRRHGAEHLCPSVVLQEHYIAARLLFHRLLVVSDGSFIESECL